MQSVEMGELHRLIDDFEHVLREVPNSRREMHRRVGAAVLEEVRRQIDSSGLNDAHGRIKGYQDYFVGSLGGYAAVRAIRGLGPHGYSDSPGALTNYLENGHRIRRPSGRAKKRRRGRAKQAYADGFHFYEAARQTAESIAYEAAYRYAEDLAQMLEG